MAGVLQPLGNQFPITNPDGTPTAYMVRWAQQRQVDIGTSVSATEAQELIDTSIGKLKIQAGANITLAPSDGLIKNSPTITASGGGGGGSLFGVGSNTLAISGSAAAFSPVPDMEFTNTFSAGNYIVNYSAIAARSSGGTSRIGLMVDGVLVQPQSGSLLNHFSMLGDADGGVAGAGAWFVPLTAGSHDIKLVYDDMSSLSNSNWYARTLTIAPLDGPPPPPPPVLQAVANTAVTATTATKVTSSGNWDGRAVSVAPSNDFTCTWPSFADGGIALVDAANKFTSGYPQLNWWYNFEAGGTIKFWASGSFVSPAGTYTPGDVFNMHYDPTTTTITLKQNGTIIDTRTGITNVPYYAAFEFYQTGYTITGITV